jgi:hypothetical protein
MWHLLSDATRDQVCQNSETPVQWGELPLVVADILVVGGQAAVLMMVVSDGCP